MDLIKLVSDINVLKFFRPTNVSFGEYAPFSNNDIRNTFKVGNIINTKNKITAGAMHTAKKPLRPLAFSYFHVPFKQTVLFKIRRTKILSADSFYHYSIKAN